MQILDRHHCPDGTDVTVRLDDGTRHVFHFRGASDDTTVQAAAAALRAALAAESPASVPAESVAETERVKDLEARISALEKERDALKTENERLKATGGGKH